MGMTALLFQSVTKLSLANPKYDGGEINGFETTCYIGLTIQFKQLLIKQAQKTKIFVYVCIGLKKEHRETTIYDRSSICRQRKNTFRYGIDACITETWFESTAL